MEELLDADNWLEVGKVALGAVMLWLAAKARQVGRVFGKTKEQIAQEDVARKQAELDRAQARLDAARQTPGAEDDAVAQKAVDDAEAKVDGAVGKAQRSRLVKAILDVLAAPKSKPEE